MNGGYNCMFIYLIIGLFIGHFSSLLMFAFFDFFKDKKRKEEIDDFYGRFLL